MGNHLQRSIGLNGIIYSHFETRLLVDEQFIREHGLCYIQSGTLTVMEPGINKTFESGELIFYRKNRLAKFIKQPSKGKDFRSITVLFDLETLNYFSRENEISAGIDDQPEDSVLKIREEILLKNFFSTLEPYFESTLPEGLLLLKQKEALMLLLAAESSIKNILFDFSHPGKIDLEAFMLQNFRFNVEVPKLALLTGRSLASFKRDFKKIFNNTPNRWLQQKRLEEARYLITIKNKKPTEVYQEVGFGNISHFSYAFKQHFGFNPSQAHNYII
jgi:AraC-like DNA-binding protein